jgi:hypothetical protein
MTSTTPADAERNLGNVYTPNSNTTPTPLSEADSKRRALEGFVALMSERLVQDDWTTIRYALEAYTQEQEDHLLSLLNASPNHITNRKPGHTEEIALAAELVTKANQVLMQVKQGQSDTGADI